MGVGGGGGWGISPGESWSMSLNSSYHKEQQYIWFRGGDLNGFRDIKSSVNWRGGAFPLGNL